jgi:hypothetical protein
LPVPRRIENFLVGYLFAFHRAGQLLKIGMALTMPDQVTSWIVGDSEVIQLGIVRISPGEVGFSPAI